MTAGGGPSRPRLLAAIRPFLSSSDRLSLGLARRRLTRAHAPVSGSSGCTPVAMTEVYLLAGRRWVKLRELDASELGFGLSLRRLIRYDLGRVGVEPTRSGGSGRVARARSPRAAFLACHDCGQLVHAGLGSTTPATCSHRCGAALPPPQAGHPRPRLGATDGA